MAYDERVAVYARFADVLRLADAELQGVFETGEAVERLWAAWALGLRGAPEMPALLHRATAHEPTPGMRAHFALMLVALGEIDAAAALARFDPAPVVRAAACRHLARVAKPSDPLNHVLLERFADPDDDVRIALVDGLRLDAPAFLVDRCDALLAHEKEAVRAAAIESILRRAPEENPFPEVLSAHLRVEASDDLVTTLLARWCEARGVANVLRATTTWDASRVVRVLAIARRSGAMSDLGASLDPISLDSLFARKDREIVHAVAGLVAAKKMDAPTTWLVDVVVRAVDASHPATLEWTAAEIAWALVEDFVARADAENLSTGERADIARLHASFARHAARIADDANIGIDAWIAWTRGGDVEEAALARIHDRLESEEFLPDLIERGIALLPTLVKLGVVST